MRGVGEEWSKVEGLLKMEDQESVEQIQLVDEGSDSPLFGSVSGCLC